MPRYFTLAEAEHLLPTVKEALHQAIAIQAEHREAKQTLEQAIRRIMASGGSFVDPEKMASERHRLDSTAHSLKAMIDGIHETGCQVKDLDLGLLDFPTLYRGSEVLLCWRTGEDAIRFWHGLEEGFRGRKPIDEEFLEHHSGDPTH